MEYGKKEELIMIEILWEFNVKADAQTQFELAYGPGGAWSKLFSRAQGFRGTTLLRDQDDPLRYLTVDVWDSLAQREQMMIEHEAAYNELASRFAAWSESKRELGVFRVMAEGTVRPQTRSRRGRTARSR